MCAPAAPTAESLHARFLCLFPRIELCVTVHFRDVRCPATKADCIAEAVALAWAWFCRLAQRGKDPAEFVTVLAGFAARAVRCGRRLCGQERAKDVLSPSAQRKYGFVVKSLPTSTRAPFEDIYARPRGQREMDALEECLHDNTRTPPPEQAAFRIDFRGWRRSHANRDRRLIDALMAGERTKDVAPHFGLSPSRISQKRREFYRDWLRFHGEVNEAEQTPADMERREPCLA